MVHLVVDLMNSSSAIAYCPGPSSILSKASRLKHHTTRSKCHFKNLPANEKGGTSPATR